MLSDKQKIKIYERFINSVAIAYDVDDLLQLQAKARYWKDAISKEEIDDLAVLSRDLDKATIRLNL